MTFDSLDPKDVPVTEQKGSTKSLFTSEELEEALSILKSGRVLRLGESFKNEGAARRAGLRVRKAIMEANPKLSISSRVWKEDEESFRAGLSKKDTKKAEDKK